MEIKSEDNMNLKEKVDFLYNGLSEKEKKKLIKKLNLPFRAKVGKRKIKKGWIGILRVDENGNIAPEKRQIDQQTFTTKDGSYHATDGSEILWWMGKFPVVFQPTWKRTPLNVLAGLRNGMSQTIADKYVLAKMKLDAIKGKKGGSIVVWIILAIILIVGISYFAKGGSISGIFGGGK